MCTMLLTLTLTLVFFFLINFYSHVIDDLLSNCLVVFIENKCF